MSSQIQITGETKVKSLTGVLTGTTGVVGSLPINGANGIPQLDSSGKILVSQLPNSVMEFKGTWDAATNTPTLANGTGNAGDVYLCNVAGTVNFGGGPIVFAVGDYVVYDGANWDRSSGAVGTVTSVGISESSAALSITGSPVTTSGTINIGFAGTSAQYVAGDGSLVTFPTTLNATNLLATVRNATGVTIPAGSLVYITGGLGNHAVVALSQADNESHSSRTFGMTQSAIANNADGYVVISGQVTDLDTSAFVEGTVLYLSPTVAGGYTSTKPSAPNHLVYVGEVIYSHPIHGTIQTRIQNGYELDELHDVSITSVANNNILKYSTTDNLWHNVAGTTTNISEGTNLYYTDARARAALSGSTGISYNSSTGAISSTITQYTDALARAAISLTTTGSSGAASYSSSTGVLNVPTYTLAGLGGITLSSLSSTATGLTYTNTTGVFSLTTGYAIPTTASQTNWDTAYTDRNKWDGGATGLVAATGRTSLGATTVGGNLFTITNPAAVTFLRINADNTVSTLDAATFRTAIGAGTSSTTGTVTSVAALTIATTGSDLSSTVATGTTTPVITLNVPTASATNRGALSSTDWSTFNGKQSAITLTTTGSSGAATFVTNTLNIPSYTLAGLGGISLTSLSATSPLSYNNSTGAFSIQVANTTQSGYLSSTDWNTFNGKQAALSGTGFVKSTAGTISYDTNTYITGNQTITLSGDVSGSGATAITTTIGALKVTNGMLAGTINYSKMDATTVPTWNQNTTGTAANITATSNATLTTLSVLSLPYSQLTGVPSIPTVSGTTNYIPKFTASSTIGNSIIQDDGTNVSVGYTTNPSLYKLDVNGTGRFSGALTGTSATFSGSVIVGTTALLNFGPTSSFVGMSGNNSTGSLALYANNTQVLGFAASTGAATFSSSVTATNLLAQIVAGADTVGGNIILSRNDTTNYRGGAIFSYYYSANAAGNQDTLSFGVSSSTTSPATVGKVKMVITEGGNLGIGTTSPPDKLTVYQSGVYPSSIGDNVIGAIANDGGAAGTLNQLGFGYSAQSAGQYYPIIIGSVSTSSSGQTKGDFFIATRDATTGTTRPSERMRITSGGVMQIANASGTLGTLVGSERLNVNGDIYASGSIIAAGGITYGSNVYINNGFALDFKGTSGTYDVSIYNGGVSQDRLNIYGGAVMITGTAGFTPPRMTSTQRLALSASGSTYCPSGTMVYDTTSNILQCWNGSAWNNLW